MTGHHDLDLSTLALLFCRCPKCIAPLFFFFGGGRDLATVVQHFRQGWTQDSQRYPKGWFPAFPWSFQTERKAISHRKQIPTVPWLFILLYFPDKTHLTLDRSLVISREETSPKKIFPKFPYLKVFSRNFPPPFPDFPGKIKLPDLSLIARHPGLAFCVTAKNMTCNHVLR